MEKDLPISKSVMEGEKGEEYWAAVDGRSRE